MRYAILSDIHSNLEALEAILLDCRRQRVDMYVCLGDIVGYGADPAECVRLTRKFVKRCIAGNHDYAVAGKIDASYFTKDGQAAVFWTQQNVSFETIEFLSRLPVTDRGDDFVMAHGSLHDAGRFQYLTDVVDAAGSFSCMEENVCFVGHTHVPRIFVQAGKNVYALPGQEAELDKRYKYIVNVGSVGQPRDGIPMAAYGIYDAETEWIGVHRVRYDIAGAQRKIRAAGLPEDLARRLELGR